MTNVLKEIEEFRNRMESGNLSTLTPQQQTGFLRSFAEEIKKSFPKVHSRNEEHPEMDALSELLKWHRSRLTAERLALRDEESVLNELEGMIKNLSEPSSWVDQVGPKLGERTR